MPIVGETGLKGGGSVLALFVLRRFAIFQHRDAPERLERSETELSSEGSVFNAFHTSPNVLSECRKNTLVVLRIIASRQG